MDTKTSNKNTVSGRGRLLVHPDNKKTPNTDLRVLSYWQLAQSQLQLITNIMHLRINYLLVRIQHPMDWLSVKTSQIVIYICTFEALQSVDTCILALHMGYVFLTDCRASNVYMYITIASSFRITDEDHIIEVKVPSYAVSDHYLVCVKKQLNPKISEMEHLSIEYRSLKQIYWKFNKYSFWSHWND